MYCPSCGARCAPDAIACHACGAILPGLTDSLPAPPSPQRARGGQRAAGSTVAQPDPGVFQQVGAQAAAHAAGGAQAAAQHAWAQHTAAAGAAPASARPIESSGAPRGADGRPLLLGRVKLVVEQGKILGEQFLLGDTQIAVGRYDAGTGRCPDIDLTAQDPAYVHRQHVRITFNDAGTELVVFDLGGRNGSYVNNQLIEKNGSAGLRLGDKLRVGRVVMRLQTAPEVDQDP